MILLIIILATLYDMKTLTFIMLVIWVLDKLIDRYFKHLHFRYPDQDDTMAPSRLKIPNFDNFWHIKQNTPKL
jgi:hypothetical protein